MSFDKISKAEESDAVAVAECHRATILAVDRKFYDERQIEAWAEGTVPSRYTEALRNGEIFVIRCGDRVAAFGWMKTAPPEVRAIYVNPSQQGRGFGSKMLNFLELQLRNIGAAEIILGASLNAQSFYEKHRYVAGDRCALKRPGASIPYISMTKKLA